jgi:Protein of unknown function (DUF3341)
MTQLVVAEFPTAAAMTIAAEAAAARGQSPIDALTPFPVPEIWHHLTHRPKRPLGWVMVAAGATAAVLAYFMQWYSASIDYPYISGDRPFNSWQVFVLVMFEACILASVIAGFVAFARDCRLPSLNHPLFEIAAIERATQDRFFLVFETGDGERNALVAFVSELRPTSTHEVAI